MPRKSSMPLRSAPLPGYGVHRQSKHTATAHSTIFRLLKVPKYANRTLARICELKSQALEEEVSRLRQEWMEKEREIEALRRELEGARRELRREEEESYAGGYGGARTTLTREEEEELEAILSVCGR